MLLVGQKAQGEKEDTETDATVTNKALTDLELDLELDLESCQCADIWLACSRSVSTRPDVLQGT